LVAAFCASAASTARFAGEISEAVDWYEKAGQTFLTLRDERRAREMLVRCEELLKKWIDALLRAEQGMQALPLLLRLAQVSGRLGSHGITATSLLNAAIILSSSQRFEDARELASQALELLPADAEESATARRLIAHCEAQIGAASRAR
jgi:tetratricopeptide (TPR) repeat protein